MENTINNLKTILESLEPSSELYKSQAEVLSILEKMPNGFVSLIETHHEVVSAIQREMSKEDPTKVVEEIYSSQGTGGLYELAEDLTRKFEEKYRDYDFHHGDYFDKIDSFLNKELYGSE